MLEPTSRFMLVDALRPPDGFGLDVAVGTTFTLDLDALLLATVSFAVFDRIDNEDGRPDPIALLESVRRHADQITVFAQAGALSGPRSHPPILGYLEETVVPVGPPRPGYIFHPKVWALRFVNADGERRYRLLVLSRNLTFDSSWDTIVQLEGAPTDAPRPEDAAVADFISSLPRLASHELDPRRAEQVAQLADELRYVGWERPDGVRDLWFHPLGPDFEAPDITGDRLMVLSPFLTPDAVRRLGMVPGPNVLVSRPASLDAVGSDAVVGFAETFVVDTADAIDFEPEIAAEDSEVAKPDDDEGAVLDIEPPRPGIELSGLHAKVYITEAKDATRLWLGSANATGAAFAGNAEFVVELELDQKQWGIDRFLDDGGKTSLRSMLAPYTPDSAQPAEPTAIEEAVRRLDSIVRELAAAAHSVHVTSLEDGYRLDLAWDPLTEGMRSRIDAHRIEVLIGPATQQSFRVPYQGSGAAVPSATLQAITSFLVIEASTRVDGQELVSRSLVNAQLTGAPEDRREQLLAGLLDDPEKVLRYLLFLLAELTGDDSLLDMIGDGGNSFDWSTGSSEMPPLLETLLRALAHTPESLDRVAEFIDDLSAGQSEPLLPPGFDDVWGPISTAREQLA